MSSQNNFPLKFRSSFFLTLLSALLIVVAISCTDMEDNGITNTELEEAQTQMKKQKSESPLYFVNGEQWDNSELNQEKLSRLKPKYIKSVDVLKGAKATDKYGEAARYGAVELTVNNPDKAFADLKNFDEPKTNESREDFFVAVEKMPELVGGLAGLQQKIRYPEKAREEDIEGRVIVQFIVDKEGNVQNPQVIKSIGGGCDEEALRVVRKAKFKPGTQRGEPVRVQYSLPITFRLSSSISQQKPTADVETPKVDGASMKLQSIQFHNGTLSGKLVSAKDNTPITGANIVIEGTSQGSATGQNGEFSIKNLSDQTHSFTISYVGYETMKGTVNR